jgi:hypothetical protein
MRGGFRGEPKEKGRNRKAGKKRKKKGKGRKDERKRKNFSD